jgi:hypothetical protein
MQGRSNSMILTPDTTSTILIELSVGSGNCLSKEKERRKILPENKLSLVLKSLYPPMNRLLGCSPIIMLNPRLYGDRVVIQSCSLIES